MKVALATHAAAKYAVENWHYSKTLPVGRMVICGIWDDAGVFAGVVIFSRGANHNVGDAFRLSQTQICELTRVATVDGHNFTVTSAVAAAMRLLRKSNPGIELVISYADPEHGHVGTIYQAGNWFYIGESSSSWQYLYRGAWCHARTFSAPSFAKAKRTAPSFAGLPKRRSVPKHRYVYPLSRKWRKLSEKMSRPYPSAAAIVDGEAAPPLMGVRPDSAAPTLSEDARP